MELSKIVDRACTRLLVVDTIKKHLLWLTQRNAYNFEIRFPQCVFFTLFVPGGAPYCIILCDKTGRVFVTFFKNIFSIF